MVYMYHKSGNMHLNREEIGILGIFSRKPWEELSPPEVKKVSGKSSQHYVYAALGKMKSLGILKARKAGRTMLYSLDLGSRAAIANLSLIEEMNSLVRNIPQKNIEELLKSIKTPFFSLIITGSYAEGRQTPKSDLDVVVIVDRSHDKRKVEASLWEGELMIPEVHLYVFTDEEFLSMLLSKEENYGKEVARKHIILEGANSYYRILREAMENGFKG
jgi:predicted nucleotidyltransferase